MKKIGIGGTARAAEPGNLHVCKIRFGCVRLQKKRGAQRAQPLALGIAGGHFINRGVALVHAGVVDGSDARAGIERRAPKRGRSKRF